MLGALGLGIMLDRGHVDPSCGYTCVFVTTNHVAPSAASVALVPLHRFSSYFAAGLPTPTKVTPEATRGPTLNSLDPCADGGDDFVVMNLHMYYYGWL